MASTNFVNSPFTNVTSAASIATSAPAPIATTDMGQVENRVKAMDIYPGFGFFNGLPRRCLLCGFTVFHKAGGQSPVALAGFNGAAAEQYFILVDR